MSVGALLKMLRERVDGLDLRRRAFLLLALMSAGYALWDRLLWASLDTHRQQVVRELQQVREDVDTLNLRTQELAGLNSQDPNEDTRERLSLLRAGLQESEAALKDLTDRLVPPDRMASVLESMLESRRSLGLLSLEGLGAEVVMADENLAAPVDQGGPNASAPVSTMRLYRHGLRLEFEGGYLEALDYLRDLEDLPWRFHWGRIELDVQDYPTSRFTLDVHTLSLDDGWIGV